MKAAAAYLVIAFLSACWFDAMDRRYGVVPGALPAGFATTCTMGAIWPVMLPVGLVMVATGWGGRWTIEPPSADVRASAAPRKRSFHPQDDHNQPSKEPHE